MGVPIIRTIVYWGLYSGTLILGDYHISLQEEALACFADTKAAGLSNSVSRQRRELSNQQNHAIFWAYIGLYRAIWGYIGLFRVICDCIGFEA